MNFKVQRFQGFFEWLPESIAAGLKITKPESPNRALVQADNKRKAVESSCHLETPVFLVTKRKDVIFAASPPRFCDSGCMQISVPHARGLTLMTLSQPNKRKCLLTNPAELFLLNKLE